MNCTHTHTRRDVLTEIDWLRAFMALPHLNWFMNAILLLNSDASNQRWHYHINIYHISLWARLSANEECNKIIIYLGHTKQKQKEPNSTVDWRQSEKWIFVFDARAEDTITRSKWITQIKKLKSNYWATDEENEHCQFMCVSMPMTFSVCHCSLIFAVVNSLIQTAAILNEYGIWLFATRSWLNWRIWICIRFQRSETVRDLPFYSLKAHAIFWFATYQKRIYLQSPNEITPKTVFVN